MEAFGIIVIAFLSGLGIVVVLDKFFSMIEKLTVRKIQVFSEQCLRRFQTLYTGTEVVGTIEIPRFMICALYIAAW